MTLASSTGGVGGSLLAGLATVYTGVVTRLGWGVTRSPVDDLGRGWSTWVGLGTGASGRRGALTDSQADFSTAGGLGPSYQVPRGDRDVKRGPGTSWEGLTGSVIATTVRMGLAYWLVIGLVVAYLHRAVEGDDFGICPDEPVT